MPKIVIKFGNKAVQCVTTQRRYWRRYVVSSIQQLDVQIWNSVETNRRNICIYWQWINSIEEGFHWIFGDYPCCRTRRYVILFGSITSSISVFFVYNTNRYRIHHSAKARNGKKIREENIYWIEITKKMTANFTLCGDIWSDWIFGQIFRITKALFRYLWTKLDIFRPKLWLPFNKNGNFWTVSTDIILLSVISTDGSGDNGVIYDRHLIIISFLAISEIRKFLYQIFSFIKFKYGKKKLLSTRRQ